MDGHPGLSQETSQLGDKEQRHQQTAMSFEFVTSREVHHAGNWSAVSSPPVPGIWGQPVSSPPDPLPTPPTFVCFPSSEGPA